MKILVYLALLLTIFIPLFWIVLFWCARKKSNAYVYALCFFIAVFFVFLTELADFTEIYTFSAITNFIYPLALISSPLFYLYFIKVFILHEKKLPLKYFFLLIIPLVQFIFSAYSFYVHPDLEVLKTYFYDIITLNNKDLPQTLLLADLANKTTIGLIIIISAVVVFLSFYTIPDAIKSVVQEYSNARQQLVRYYIIILSANSLFIISTIIQFMTISKFDNLIVQFFVELFWAGAWFIIGFYMYTGLRYKDKLIELPKMRVKEDSSFVQKLKLYIETEKVFLYPELKINDIAYALGTNRTYLSKILNEELQTNFNDFVNLYRVSASKKLLLDNALSMKELAVKSGFNSYSTFFRAFKKCECISPYDFLKKNNIS